MTFHNAASPLPIWLLRALFAAVLRRWPAVTFTPGSSSDTVRLRPMTPRTSPLSVLRDRKSARFPFEAELIVLLPGSSRIHGHCRDLSQDGLGAYLGREIEPGQPVLLQFPLTPSARIARTARVVHRLGLRHGFEFLRPFDPTS